MARIPQSNRRFRTRQELCRDMALVLNSDLHYGTKCVVLDNAMWVWSEFDGKYEGCRFWSKAASGLTHEEKLIHDHAVPKKVLIDLLLNTPNPTLEFIQQFFQTYCLGAVITKTEDDTLNRLGLRSNMPLNWDLKDPWARYKAAGIVLRDEESRIPHPDRSEE